MNCLISFGPLRAYIDEVRFITNRSTGTFGYRLLKEALLRRYSVRAVVGKTGFSPPQGVSAWIEAEEYEGLKKALQENYSWADVLIMAAAVPDFIPLQKEAGKIPREKGKLNLKLKATESIIGILSKKKGRNRKILIGFSLEKEDAIKKAQQKAIVNNLDFTIAVSLDERRNPYGNQDCSVSLVSAGRVEKLPVWSKKKIAKYVFDFIEQNKDILRKK